MYLCNARKLEAITARCDAIRCPGLHDHYTDARNEFAILPEMEGYNP